MNVYQKFKRLSRPKGSAILLFIFVLLALIIFAGQKPKKADTSEFDQIISQKNYKEFASFTIKNGITKTYENLKAKFPGNDPAAHDFAHVIGISAYKKEGLAGLKYCDLAFNYGCFHGFIESFLALEGPQKVARVEDYCISLGTVHAPSCLHGIGHGLMVNRSYELKQALSDCDTLKQTSQVYCWDGVFMERNTGSMLEDKIRVTIDPNDPNKPCSSIDPIYHNECYRNQVFAWFQAYEGNVTTVATRCQEIEQDVQSTCFETIGLANVNANSELTGLIGYCRQITVVNGQDNCLIGSMKELLFEGKSKDLAYNLCYYTSEKNRTNCQEIFANQYAEYQIRFPQR